MNEAMKNFAYNPVSLSIPRSKMTMRHSHKTTYNTGLLIPIYWREVLPGSTVKMELSQITRMQTPLFPIMDNAFQDTMFFFVPNRLLWTHWEEFMGENKSGFWEQPIDYEVPQIKFNSDQTITQGGAPYWIKGNDYYKKCVQAGSLADYLGIPISDANLTTPFARGEFDANALPFRAYYQVYNDWWRDENLMNPLEYDKGDSTVTAELGGTDPEAGWCLMPPPEVAKFHDYYTSALPQPQKHDDVMLPLGKEAIVKLGDSTTSNTNTSLYGNVALVSGANNQTTGSVYNIDSDGNYQNWVGNKVNALYADLSSAVGASINSIRQAFAVQRYYEKQARGGSRYIEQLHTMFGVISPDARLQRAEYLGGCRKAINIDQVVQTSSTDSVTPQGNVSAYSLTTQNEELFTKSFVEHGILIGVQCIRLEHSYQDGLFRMWQRRSVFDYYNPTFANIGDQAIRNSEIWLAGNVSGSKDDEAFGYQEAWAEYRYMNSRVSGEMRSKYHQSLDAWHFADNYGGLPRLSSDWIKEYEFTMNRNIAVSARLADQWLADIFFKETWTQPMPTYSVPGLIDHF